LGSEETCCRWKAGVAATEKNRRIAIDEELLITGVSVSEENQRVLNDGVSASWMNDERLLANGVSATWMNDEGLLANGVSATKEAKQLLDGIVSSMMEGEKDDGKGMKNAEQWCFSIGETGEKLLTIGVSATGENERLLVFRQQEKLLRMVLQQRKGEKAKQVLDGVVSGVRMMGGWDVSVTGKK
jgi:hypothetical protein